jgi:pyruvate dehydrogenase E1 component beta subunit
VTRVLSYREALGDALRAELARDERVIVLGQDVGARGGAYGVTAGLLEAFGAERVRDAPGSEAAVVGFGIGAAMAGMRPVVELTTAAFAALALDQLAHHAAPLRTLSGGRLTAPLVVRLPQTTGARLGPVHSATVEALFHHIPGLTVWAPATPADARAMLVAAIRADDPVIVLEHTLLYDLRGPVDDEATTAGAGAAIRRSGDDVTITAASRMTSVALAAAELLATEHGIDAEILDLRTLRPLDDAAVLASVARTGHAVLVEEGPPAGGPTATLAATIATNRPGTPLARVTGADASLPYAATLERAALPDAHAIVAAVRALLARGGAPTHGRDRDRATGPAQSRATELDMEALIATRRATGTSLAALVADAAAPLVTDAVVVTDGDGPTIVLGAPPSISPVTIHLGPVATRPRAHAGAVTIHHIATLTVAVESGEDIDATILLTSLRKHLENPAAPG